MKLPFKTKISFLYVSLLALAQVGSLFAIYWWTSSPSHQIPMSEFILIAIAESAALLIGSLFIFRLMLKRLYAHEKELFYQSQHDPVTGLPNRLYFFDYLTNRINAGTDETPLAIMTIGIDRFPQINQALGYQIGDRILHHVGERLQSSIPNAELIGRLASNIFIVLLPNITRANYTPVAESVLELFATPFSVYTVQIDLDVLIGISFFPQDDQAPAPLIQKADLALYTARYSSERYETYQVQKDPHHSSKLSLMSELREGLTQDEFQVFYQPKVNLQSSKTVQVEALIRWLHPSKGYITPDQFIPLAEETGHIKKLTLWLLEKGIQQCKQWHTDNIPLGVSINLSVKDLLNKKLPAYVGDLINQNGVDPSWITLEITESAFMREPEYAIEAANKLKAVGVNLSIDDFGTGYSSLTYLKKLPVNELKIDKSFTQDIIHSERVAHIVQSTIGLGHSLNMKIVAEGLSDENTLKNLKDFHCDLGQGYYFSQPLPLKEFSEWLSASPWGLTTGGKQTNQMD